jgi:hypothetical protein
MSLPGTGQPESNGVVNALNIIPLFGYMEKCNTT